MATLTNDRPVRARTGLGLILAGASASSFGLSGPLARGLMDAGWSAATVVAVRVLLAAAVLGPIALYQLRGDWNLLRRNTSLILAYGLFAVAGTQLGYFNAVAHMQVGVALLIEYTAPIAVVGWLWVRHRRRPGVATVCGGILGILGLILVLDLRSGLSASWVGIAWALGAMVGAAGYFLLSAHGDGSLPGTVLATGGLLIGGLGLLAAGAAGILPMAATANPVTFRGFETPWWVPILALGVVTAAIAYVTGIAATRLLGSRLASFVALGEVLAALIFAWALLGETPRLLQFLGGALILTGVVIVRRGEDG
ncbi:drug/metabolite transporter (DMT)-like permease [Nocardia transvalensis]|uniref:Drug/metabolite transporter (DMT)-like permease n=1 Tax=Nocardia transvalensis TaxID=37333 RepID=A0A7W9PE86_9NOCA|nr:DMT family transporter [Nocardia transvalensis]MBB5914499.1 drug/metabolite transporter (DMT)-like permease [Nocardia transvalensis]